jgi:hypothetical protein
MGLAEFNASERETVPLKKGWNLKPNLLVTAT